MNRRLLLIEDSLRHGISLHAAVRCQESKPRGFYPCQVRTQPKMFHYSILVNLEEGIRVAPGTGTQSCRIAHGYMPIAIACTYTMVTRIIVHGAYFNYMK